MRWATARAVSSSGPISAAMADHGGRNLLAPACERRPNVLAGWRDHRPHGQPNGAPPMTRHLAAPPPPDCYGTGGEKSGRPFPQILDAMDRLLDGSQRVTVPG